MNFILFYFFSKASSLATNITISNWENFTGLPMTNIINYNNNHEIPLLKTDPTFFKRNPPLFIFCFTSWCPHCKKARPGWEQFQDEVKSDINFIAGSLNCSSDTDLCEQLKIRSLPTFLTYYHGDIREINVRQNIKSYHQIGNKLSLIQQEKYIKQYDQIDNKLTDYPSFVFTFDYKSENEIESNFEATDLNNFNYDNNNDKFNDIEANEIVSRVIIASNLYEDEYFYLNSTQKNFLNTKNQNDIKTQRKAKVFIDDDISIDMKGDFTFDNILNFVSENCHKLFGDWSFMSLRSIKRKFAVYAESENKKNLNCEVKNFAIQNLDKFAWGSAKEFGIEQFNKIFKLKTSDFPAIVLIDIRLSKFAKLKKIKNKDEIVHFFNEIENYQFEIDNNEDKNESVVKKKNIQSLFEPLEVNNEIDDLLELINSILTVFVSTLVVLLLISAIGFLVYCFYFKKPAPKYD